MSKNGRHDERETSEHGRAGDAGVTYQHELVSCGKPQCRKCAGAGAGHGPYWYAYWTAGGKTRKRYIGKDFRELTAADVAGAGAVLGNADELERVTRMSPQRAASLGWHRVSSSNKKTDQRWQHDDGRSIAHCGHPTTLHPWELVDRSGTFLGTASNLGQAMDVATWRARAKPPRRAKSSGLRASRRRVVFVVGCGAAKRSGTHAAEFLYTGSLFRAAKNYVEAQGAPWYIVSAKHGLMRPTDRIASYEQRLTGTLKQRGVWGADVAAKLSELEGSPRAPFRVVLLAGAEYAAPLLRPFRELGIHVEQPLHGMQLGDRLHWLVSHTR